MGAGEEVPRPPLDLTPASLSAARSGRRALELYLARYDDRGGESNGGGASPSSSSSEETVARRLASSSSSRLALPSDRGRVPLDRVDGDAPPGPPPLPAVDPEILRRLDERLCAGLRVASSSSLTRRRGSTPRHLPGGRIVKPLLPWVRSRPSSELLHRHEWADAEWSAARHHAPPRGGA